MSENSSQSTVEAVLLEEAPKQWEIFHRNKANRLKGKAKWQQEIEGIDGKVANVKAKASELRRQYDPELMRISANYDRKKGFSSGLARARSCPKCNDTDQGNKVNGIPWCMKCNIALGSPYTIKKHLSNVRILPKHKKLDVTFSRLDEGKK